MGLPRQPSMEVIGRQTSMNTPGLNRDFALGQSTNEPLMNQEDLDEFLLGPDNQHRAPTNQSSSFLPPIPTGLKRFETNPTEVARSR